MATKNLSKICVREKETNEVFSKINQKNKVIGIKVYRWGAGCVNMDYIQHAQRNREQLEKTYTRTARIPFWYLKVV